MDYDTGASKYNMRERQKEILIEMIRAAVPSEGGAMAQRGLGGQQHYQQQQQQGQVNWKVLLYDAKGRDIIAPLLKVKELHDMGVTLPLLMTKEGRTAVSNTPAVYLCEPTEQNITIIARDCGRQLYQWVYINFTSQCPRPMMEALAEQLAATGTLAAIRHIRVYDQALSFVAETNDLYSLMLKNSFVTLNSRTTADADMEAHVDGIALGLSHVLMSQQTLPIVAYARNGPAEMIGQRLSSLLGDLQREGLIGGGSSSPNVGPSSSPLPPSGGSRPLLLVVDRSSDLAAGLHHPFSYRGLLIDSLGMRLNKVKTATEQGGTKTLDIDPLSDAVYSRFGGCDFGEFSENVQRALDDFKREYAALSGNANSNGVLSMGGGGDILGTDKAAITEMLANAPKMRDQKQSLDAHVMLAHTVLTNIQRLGLDKYHGVEAAVLFGEGFDATAFAELMNSSTPLEDKQRIYLVCYAAAGAASDEARLAEIERHRHCVEGEGRPFAALHYVQKLRQWSARQQQHLGGGGGDQQSAAAYGWSLAQTLAKNITFTFSQSGTRYFTLTRMVDALLSDASGAGGGMGGGMGGRGGGVSGGAAAAAKAKVLEGIGAIEPRTGRPIDLSDIRLHNVIVFVAGGGSINEYDNLKQWEAEHPRKSVIYGSTDMLSGGDLLEQLAILGAE